MRNIVLTKNNVVKNGLNNKFTYSFPRGGVTFRGHKIGLQSLSQYYSNFNISATRYNNNKFQYEWQQVVSGSFVFDVELPDGFYDASHLDSFLQSIMLRNGHYLINDLGQNVFYLKISTNDVYYSIQLDEIALPASLPTGWSYPPNADWTTSARAPVFRILENGFRDIIGYEAGRYPPDDPWSSTSQSQLSSKTPEVSPVSTILMRCSLLNNSLDVTANVLFAYVQSTRFGGLENFHPYISAASHIQDGSYTDITIEFTDEFFRPIKFEDPSTTIILNIYDPEI
jgi:hypothetical protein